MQLPSVVELTGFELLGLVAPRSHDALALASRVEETPHVAQFVGHHFRVVREDARVAEDGALIAEPLGVVGAVCVCGETTRNLGGIEGDLHGNLASQTFAGLLDVEVMTERIGHVGCHSHEAVQIDVGPEARWDQDHRLVADGHSRGRHGVATIRMVDVEHDFVLRPAIRDAPDVDHLSGADAREQRGRARIQVAACANLNPSVRDLDGRFRDDRAVVRDHDAGRSALCGCDRSGRCGGGRRDRGHGRFVVRASGVCVDARGRKDRERDEDVQQLAEHVSPPWR